jgi:solute carrier family 13 (sodium-dependent dicarboxylate transporter), member 2/3/5
MKISKFRIVSLFSGPIVCLLIMLLPTTTGLTPAGRASLATLGFCIFWWLLGAVPLPVTSLVGLALLSFLGALPTQVALSLFGSQAVFFIVGVFLIAAVMLQTGLSARMSLWGLQRFGNSENSLCITTLILSWGLCAVMVSHAVAALLLPIILGIIRSLHLNPRSKLARRLLLSMAWGTVCGSNIGLLSSARAALALELYENYRIESSGPMIGMMEYSLASIPISIVSLILSGLLLRWLFPPEGVPLTAALEQLNSEIKQKGPLSLQEISTSVIILIMIVAMIIAGPNQLGIVALLFSGVFFAFQLLQWEDAERYVNWGVVLLYGGAIAVGAAVHQTGAAEWLVGQVLPSHSIGPWIVLLSIASFVALSTELISNSAVIAIVLPVALAMSEQVGLSPRAIAIAVPVSAGLAFVLPTSTPAMAMVFGSGYLRTRDTFYGVFISLLTLLLFLLVAMFWWPLLGILPLENV